MKIKLLLGIVVVFLVQELAWADRGALALVNFLETPYLSSLSENWQIVLGSLVALTLVVIWIVHFRTAFRKKVNKNEQ